MSKAQEYKDKVNDIVKTYNALPSYSFEDILLKTEFFTKKGFNEILNPLDNGLELTTEELEFKLAKQKADQKLSNIITELKDSDNIDKRLSELIETCNAHASLKSGVVEFKLGKQLEVFNYSLEDEGSAPKANVIMRDARLQDFIDKSKNVFTPPLLYQAAHVVDTYIANMTGTARGAIALIDKSDKSPKQKALAKKQCIELLKKKSEEVIKWNKISSNLENEVNIILKGNESREAHKLEDRDFELIDAYRKDFSKDAVGEVKNFNDELFAQLNKQELTIGKKNFKSDKKLSNAISAARDCAMMNTSDDHCHVVTIHRTIEVEGQKQNGFSFSAIADPIPKELRKDYEAIKKITVIDKSGDKNLPKWYQDKTSIEQKMIADNIDNYLSGKCILSSQDRTVAGVVNYYAQVEGVLDSEGKIVKDKNIILQRGTFGDRQTKHSYPETVKACVGHMSRVASKVAFQNVATNSLLGKIFGKKKESILHASVKKAVNDNTNTKYQQNGLNTLSLVTSFFRRGKAVKNITTSFSKPEEMVSMFCMSSKDRTSMGIMAGITESFFNGKTKQDKQDFASSMIDSGHNQTLAARQGGTPGVAGLKLSDSLKSVMGLGAIGKLLKKSVNANKAIPKLNKFKVKKEGVIKKLKNFLGLGKNDRQELESIKLSIVSKKKNKGLEILKLNIKQNDIKSSRMK